MYQINGHKLLQYPGELEELCSIFFEHNVRSYLEIGCKFGGSLWTIGRSLPEGSRIVAVDLMAYRDIVAGLMTAADELRKFGYDLHLIKGNSTNQNIVRDVKKLGPFDACLIDGDHTLKGVRSDWENYGPMCKLVAFHDINWSRPAGHPDRKYSIDVPEFWNGIKADYRHVEIKRDRRDNGIGLLWR